MFNSFVFRWLLGLLTIVLAYSGLMATLDPYMVVRQEIAYKNLPNNPLYSYNLIKHWDHIDYGFLGSSAVNYLPIEQYYPDTHFLYSMGIESSNIHEHIAYGKVLAAKHPKEIIFFVTFYTLNPARGNQLYFNPWVVQLNNPLVDFVHQYFNQKAFWDALAFRHHQKTKEPWQQEFNLNGTRTQNFYKLDTAYNYDKTLADYLAWLYLDPRYYASTTFRNPQSIEAGLQAIKDFKAYLHQRGIRLRLVSCPEERNNLVMIYRAGLGPTYEAYRQGLASIQPFDDLNLDRIFTTGRGNFWDTHHFRHGQLVIADLKSGRFLVNTQTVQQTMPVIRPEAWEYQRLNDIFLRYDGWDKMRQQVAEDLRRNPSKVP